MNIKELFAKFGKESIDLGPQCSINTKGELLLYGDIGDWWEGLDALSIVRQLDLCSSDQIVVRIHSGGGSIAEGLAMYNQLKQCDKPVIVYVDGIAASMATAIAMAGKERHIPKNALMHIHRAHGPAYGDVEGIEDAAKQLAVFEQTYLQILSDATGQSIEKLSEIISDRKDHWYQGQQAVDFGLATHVVDYEIQAEASVDIKKYSVPDAFAKALFSSKPQSQASTATIQTRKNTMRFLFKASGDASVTSVMLTALAAVLTEQYKTVEAANDALSIDGVTADVLSGAKEVTDEQVKSIMEAVGLTAFGAAAVQADASISVGTINKFNKIAASAGMGVEHVDGWIRSGVSVEDAGAQALAHMKAANDGQLPNGSGVRVVPASTDLRGAVAHAMLASASPSRYKHTADSSEFANMSLMEMAKACLALRGESVRGKGVNEIMASSFNTTSDFPLILQDVANKEMLSAYQSGEPTFKKIARRATANDFKSRNVMTLGRGSELEKLGENGEIKTGKVSEAGASYRLSTFARAFNFGREMMINDDLSAFTQFFSTIGMKAKTLESREFWEQFTSGTLKFNGSNLFHATASTQITGTADLSAALALMTLAMRKQKELDGDYVDLSPAFLVVSPEREIEARKLLSAVQATSTGDVNVFANSMSLIVENRLSGQTNNPFYLFADPSLAPAFEYCYLRGNENPYIEAEQVFGTRGMKLAIAHDFGVGVVGGLGVVKNPGAAS